jgi:hypothetical protein
MMLPKHTPRAVHRGAALLLALLIATLVPVASLALLRTASNSQLQQRLSEEDRAARGLARDASALVLAWASAHASADWFGDGDEAPLSQRELGYRTVLDTIDPSTGWSLRITAIDLCGRLHITHLGSAAATGVPTAVRDKLDAQRIESLAPARQDDADMTTTPPLLEALLIDGGGETHLPINTSDWERAPMIWLTTHGTGSLNIRTSPLTLLDAALASADPSDRLDLLARRRAGEPIPASLVKRLAGPALERQSRREDADPPLRFTGTSEAIGFLVESTSPSGRVDARWIVAGLRAQDDAQGTGQRAGARARSWAILENRRVLR